MHRGDARSVAALALGAALTLAARDANAQDTTTTAPSSGGTVVVQPAQTTTTTAPQTTTTQTTTTATAAPVIVETPSRPREVVVDRPTKEEREEEEARRPRFGPLVGAGLLTHPIDLELFGRFEKVIGIGVDYAFLPTLTWSDISISTWAIGGDFRLFIFGGSFFLGLGAGWEGGTASQPDLGSISVSSPYVLPRVGWLFTLPFGLSIGIDGGAMIALAPTTRNDSSVAIRQETIDRVDLYAKTPLPDVKLRVGWLF